MGSTGAHFSKEHFVDIVGQKLEGLAKEIYEMKQWKLSVSDSFVTHLAMEYYEPKLGIRPLRNEIDKLRTLISKKAIECTIQADETIEISLDENEKPKVV